MRALLDTNIIIHRENKKVSNKSIGLLFYWLDKLRFEKLIHRYSITEISKYNDDQVQETYKVKLSAYNQLKTIAPQTDEFRSKLNGIPKTENDQIDNQLLCELYSGRVDILITEDRKMRNKAVSLGISNRVYSINSFIEYATNENPDLIAYKALAVKKERFGNIDISNSFFDTFKKDYNEFESWFAKKSDEEAYVCISDGNQIQGFLYLKIENSNENYSDINPPFQPKKRLKVGTFKVEATGFRLGERFLKIIFDNAILYNVDEIYVTLFDGRQELKALEHLLKTWGFIYYGKKNSNEKTESVLIKHMNYFDNTLSAKANFPNVDYKSKKYFLPIFPQFHTRLLPDARLDTESPLNFLDKTAERYSLEKIYISSSYKREMAIGDIILIYRNGVNAGRKGFESVVSTVAVISELKYNFFNKEDFISSCQNRTVFTLSELNDIWDKYYKNLLIIKFIPADILIKKPILQELWNNNIISFPKGPRPFDSISDNDFDTIIKLSNTELYNGAK